MYRAFLVVVAMMAAVRIMILQAGLVTIMTPAVVFTTMKAHAVVATKGLVPLVTKDLAIP